MKIIDIMLKCVALLYRESTIREELSENSSEMIKSVLKTIPQTSKLHGSTNELTDNLRHYITNMVAYPDTVEQTAILNSLEIILKDSDGMYGAVSKTISSEINTNATKRYILATRSALRTYLTRTNVISLLTESFYATKTDNLQGKTIEEFGLELISKLETMVATSDGTDPGIVDELDINDDDAMVNLLERVKDQADGTAKLRTGWKKINIMIQGGFSRHETVIINALQHKFKSGFTQSLFMQLLRHNKPVMKDPTKKPLMVFISFEDDVEIIGSFMYRYLYMNEHGELPDMSKVSSKDIATYLKNNLTQNGYHIKILRVNPSEWTYRDLLNKILYFESLGYEIHACFVDYLAKLSTTGLDTNGAMGSAVRELFNRCRNFFGSKKILFVTPHQLSTEAKQLIRNGVSDVNFVKEIAGKGYTELSKQIDQVVDLELYLHIARINRLPYLTVQRGKHRNPTILNEEDMYALLPFPNKAPIKEDINDADDGLSGMDNDTGEFDF